MHNLIQTHRCCTQDVFYDSDKGLTKRDNQRRIGLKKWMAGWPMR